MKTLIISSNTFKRVSDLTKPTVKDDPENEIMYREFNAPDVPNHFGTGTWSLITKLVAQEITATMKKMQTGDILLYADSDILFFEKPSYFAKQLGDSDFKFQFETGFGPCFGFFVTRISPETIALIEKTAELTNEKKNSQIAFLEASRGSALKITYFDTKEVWNYAVLSGGAVWKGEPFDFPTGLKAIHANFIVGVDRKVEFINKALSIYEKISI